MIARLRNVIGWTGNTIAAFCLLGLVVNRINGGDPVSRAANRPMLATEIGSRWTSAYLDDGEEELDSRIAVRAASPTRPPARS